MFWYLLLLFCVGPFVELALLLKLANVISWQLTLVLVIVTGVVGTWLARSQGIQTYRRIQRSLAAGEMPTQSLLDAALIFVAGAMLLTPGLLTDLLGFSLLVPYTRRFIRQWLVRSFQARVRVHIAAATSAQPRSTSIIDSYVVESSAGDEFDDRPRIK